MCKLADRPTGHIKTKRQCERKIKIWEISSEALRLLNNWSSERERKEITEREGNRRKHRRTREREVFWHLRTVSRDAESSRI